MTDTVLGDLFVGESLDIVFLTYDSGGDLVRPTSTSVQVARYDNDTRSYQDLRTLTPTLGVDESVAEFEPDQAGQWGVRIVTRAPVKSIAEGVIRVRRGLF